jgi:hypothetical protein
MYAPTSFEAHDQTEHGLEPRFLLNTLTEQIAAPITVILNWRGAGGHRPVITGARVR